MATRERPHSTHRFLTNSCQPGMPAVATGLPRPRGEEVKQMQRIFAWAHSHVAALHAKEEGQTMAEYAVILALITAAVVGVMAALGTNILTVIRTVTEYIVPAG